MRIRTQFLACMCAVAALATCLAGWNLLQLLSEFTLAGRIARAVEIDGLLFFASDKIGLERPIIGDALLADHPIDAATRARLTAIRQATDAALITLESRIANVSDPGAEGQLAVVRKTRADLARWRANVDATLSLPKSQRDAKIFGVYITSLNAVFDATSSALDMGDLAASQHDGTSVELISLARHVWSVRATMGIRTVPLMSAIDKHLPLDHDALEAQAGFDGELRANWVPITALARRLASFTELAAAIQSGREAFDAYNGLCARVVATGRDAADYPLSALALGAQVVRTAPLLLKIRDVALAAASSRAIASRQDALVHVLIASLVLGLTAIAMIAVMTVLERRIVSPLLSMTAVIGRFARLDFSLAIPGQERPDEIGRMAVALDALRRGALAGEENKARIAHMARHDALTGLLNRLGLRDCLEQAVAMAGRGVISATLCLDLDRFKAVNDTFGHPMGDLLLRSVATRLQAAVREGDAVARQGGDEFVVILCGIEIADNAAVVAERIVRVLSEPYVLDGQTVRIGASAGIALTPRDSTSCDDLLKYADTALYSAKQAGKGNWRFYEPEMDAKLRDRAALERDLWDAHRDGLFALAFQPQYTLASRDFSEDRLCGFEALLRWPHKTRGLIPPAEFIPIAEETGLIVGIGAWVLREACREAARWPDHVNVAVNLSCVQLNAGDFIATVRESLADSGLPANRLELEVTETALLQDSHANLTMLNELHAMGIRIAMDDFGTGYSSLCSLRGFPFDRIKIDRSFVKDLSNDADARAIVGAVAALANGLGMATTAEGVETMAQLDELRRLRCSEVQGYLFGKPTSAMEARRLIALGGEPKTTAETDDIDQHDHAA